MTIPESTGYGPRKIGVSTQAVPNAPRLLPIRKADNKTSGLALLEAALLDAERARDAARRSWLDTPEYEKEAAAHRYGIYRCNEGVMMGVQWAIDIVNGGQR